MPTIDRWQPTAILVLASVLAIVTAPVATSSQALVSPCPGCGFPPEPVDAKNHAGWTQI